VVAPCPLPWGLLEIPLVASVYRSASGAARGSPTDNPGTWGVRPSQPPSTNQPLLSSLGRSGATSGISKKEMHSMDKDNEEQQTRKRIEAGLPDFPNKKYLKSDVDRHIARYPDIVQLNLKIGIQLDKIEFVKDIIKSLHNRSFVIKDAISWILFTNGQN
jgi:hypothetical protein